MIKMDKLDVAFRAVESEYDNCSCDCCHALERVTKLSIPATKFYDGHNLTTKYLIFWMCGLCRDKLMQALNNAEREA